MLKQHKRGFIEICYAVLQAVNGHPLILTHIMGKVGNVNDYTIVEKIKFLCERRLLMRVPQMRWTVYLGKMRKTGRTAYALTDKGREVYNTLKLIMELLKVE